QRKERSEPGQRKERSEPGQRKPLTRPAKGMERFRIEVGHQHDVNPGNIVGAIANEAGLDGQHIGHIDIHADFSVVDLPSGMPNDVFQDLRKAWVCGQRLDISRLEKPAKKKSGQKAKKSKKRATITLSKP
ncbi:MAG: DbpA RNA binding domain-containing protein, partial [Halocynthiibacter sp.]